MEQNAVVSFIRSLAYREQVEVGASIELRDATTSITYANPLTWPWPRQFNYNTEFFCVGTGENCLRAVNCAEGKSDHVVNLFASDPHRESQPFLDVGYVQAWISQLLARPLATDWVRSLAADVQVHEVTNTEDMARYASLPGISNPGIARDPAIHNFFVAEGSDVVAKGQLVSLPARVAYISDMFTSPDHRRKGLCHRIMRALENKARELGATHVCLAPGYEVSSYDLYGKYGYARVAARSVLISPVQQT